MDVEEKKKQAYQRGGAIFILLIFLSLGEFFMGRYAPVWATPILAIALLKAIFVVRDYMHIGRVFAGEEESS